MCINYKQSYWRLSYHIFKDLSIEQDCECTKSISVWQQRFFKALHTFTALENPHYENILQDENFKERCRENDPEGFKVLYPEDDIDLSSLDID